MENLNKIIKRHELLEDVLSCSASSSIDVINHLMMYGENEYAYTIWKNLKATLEEEDVFKLAKDAISFINLDLFRSIYYEYEDCFKDDDYTTSKLVELIDSKLDVEDNDTIIGKLMYMKDTLFVLNCPGCNNNLLENGIYERRSVTMTWNESKRMFLDDSSEGDDIFLCCECDKNVTNLVRDYI